MILCVKAQRAWQTISAFLSDVLFFFFQNVLFFFLQNVLFFAGPKAEHSGGILEDGS